MARNRFCYRFCGLSIDGGHVDSCLVIACMLVAGALALIMIVLLALSVQDVGDDEVAIPYDKVARSVGTLLEGGKHLLTPATKLYKYDSKFISNVLKFPCISKDGLEIDLHVVQQYRLFKDEVKSLFFTFGGQGYVDEFVSEVTKSATREACALFDGELFFGQRNEVEAAIIRNVTSAINAVQAHAEPGFVQLFAVYLPSAFESSIEAKQLAIEDIAVARNQRAQAVTGRQTELAEARLQADITLNAANSTAEGIIIEAHEKATARRRLWEERAEAFLLNMEALGVDAEEYVDEYLFPQLLAESLSAEQQACLRLCNPAVNDCWYCFTDAIAATIP